MNDQKIFTEFQKLVGKKITLFKFSEFGMPQAINCELKETYLKDYAQYKDALHIVIRPAKKRTDYIFRFHDYHSFIVWAGHFKINAEMYPVKVESKTPGVTVRQGFTCFSDDYFNQALNSVNEAPVILYNKK